MSDFVTQLKSLEKMRDLQLAAALDDQKIELPKASRQIKLFGPPGEGKGTLSKFISMKEGYTPVEGSDLFKEFIAHTNPELQREIKDAMNGGKLAPDEAFMNYFFGMKYNPMQQALARGHVKGYTFVGLPRTIGQAERMKDAGVRFDITSVLKSDKFTPVIRQLSRAIDDLLETGERRPDADRADGRVNEYENNKLALLEILPTMSGHVIELHTLDTPGAIAYDFFAKAAGRYNVDDPVALAYHAAVRKILTASDNGIEAFRAENAKSVSQHYGKPEVKAEVVKFEKQIIDLKKTRDDFCPSGK